MFERALPKFCAHKLDCNVVTHFTDEQIKVPKVKWLIEGHTTKSGWEEILGSLYLDIVILYKVNRL